MRQHVDPAGRRCRPAGTSGSGQGRRGDPGGRGAVRPPTGPGPYPRPGVRVRFTPSEVPVLTCTPAGHPAALRGAAEALARMGRSDLGGRLEVGPPGGPPSAVRLAAGRAVESALRGGLLTPSPVPSPGPWVGPWAVPAAGPSAGLLPLPSPDPSPDETEDFR